MPIMTTSQYFGVKEPTESYGARSSAAAQFQPTMGDVIGANIEETFQGEGSFVQDVSAGKIRRQEKYGTPLTQDEWKTSPSYREGLKYYEGMTTESAQTLADIEDDRQRRNQIFERSTGFQAGVGGTIGFLSGIAEPKNLATGVAAALFTGGASLAIPSVGRLLATNTVKGAAKRGVVEGVVGAALTEPSNIESSKIVQGDYTMTDSLLNLTLGSILGAGLGAGGKALELRSRAKQLEVRKTEREVLRAYRAETRKQAIEEFDTALWDIIEGRSVDVEPVKPILDANTKSKAIKAIETIEAQKVQIAPIEQIKADIEVKAQEIQQLDEQIKTLQEDMPTPEVRQNIEALKAQKEDAQAEVNKQQLELEKADKLSAKQDNIKSSVLKEGDEVAIRQGDGVVKEITPDGYKIAMRDGGEVTAPLKDIQLKPDNIQNNTKVTSALQRSQKPNKSSAYDDVKTDEVYEKTKNTPEEQLVQAELEDYQAELQQMLDEGQLTASDMDILERLAKTEDDIEIFDNIFDNMNICLTRG